MIPQANAKSIASIHRNLGLSMFEEGQYGRAFAHFSLALTLEPALKADLRDIYLACLYTWCDKLESEEKLSELFVCYEQAISSYGDSVDVHFSLANQLNRLGHIKEAAKFYKKCLVLDSNHIPSFHNLAGVYNKLVERWHFRMLNDKVRNCAYKQAIARKIAEGHLEILDIGTGTGLLSIFAVENGAKQVYACDHSPVMVEIASEIFQKMGYLNKVKLIEKTSTELSIPNDVPNRVSLIVTETMDAGVFGENLLETVIHAWKELLVLNPNSIEVSSLPPSCCIPQAVTIYAVPIQSAYLAKKYRYCKNQPELSSVNLRNFVAILDEPYDSEDLRRLSNNVCYLSKPVQIITANLNNPEGLSQLYGMREMNSQVLKVACCGRVDAIACFFKVNLDENIVLSTSPWTLRVASCWEQAIFPCVKPVYVTSGEELSLNVNCFKGKVSVHLPEEKITEANKSLQFSKLLQDNIRLLNDVELMNTLKTAAAELSLSHSPSDTPCSILDLSSVPILSLLFMHDIQKSRGIRCDLRYFTGDDTVQNFVKLYLEDNKVLPLDLKPFFAEDLFSFFLQHEEMYDIIIVNNLVLPDGTLNDRMFLALPVLRKRLKTNGIIIPEKLTCMGQFINCDWLSKVSSVVPDSENEISEIATVLNQYQVPIHCNLNLDSIEYDELSFEFELFSITTIEASEEKLHSDISVSITRTGILSATAMWFVVNLLPKMSLIVSFKSSESSVDQSACLMMPPCRVSVDSMVILNVGLEKGLLKLTMNPGALP
ncbi:LOW QUALITY PROTEIN: protein arginine N-methyltransferase 9 [Bemisia tabaci]|uniref:LOW QUALITY PROTEIN: protein arginine N-methyltransferase 9 n=1 Tax=Bemisia tabaci TaxID=7038 RepID=UPI003B27E7B2